MAATVALDGAVLESATKVLTQCLAGETQEANATPQLQHLFFQSPHSVLAALAAKLGVVAANADAGAPAMRAGQLLVSLTLALDSRAADAQKGEKSSLMDRPSASRAVLDHLIRIGGGVEKAAREKPARVQACALVATLMMAVVGHKDGEKALLQYATDKVPSIREKATRGLAVMQQHCPAAERALAGLTADSCTAVRASSVRSLRVTPVTAPQLLERIDDVEACVRAQLFLRLADQPAAVGTFGAAALSRLVAGLTDRAGSVRQAAGSAVDAWREQFGGLVGLINRCDVTTDEALGEAVAGALAVRYPSEATAVAKDWLMSRPSGNAKGKKDTAVNLAQAPIVLLTRMAFVSMSDENRDEALDLPLLLKRAREAEQNAPKVWTGDAACKWSDFLIRQLLRILAAVDICDEAIRRDVEQVARDVLMRVPIPSGLAHQTAHSSTGRFQLTVIDLAVLIIRRCSGLNTCSYARKQAVESKFSKDIVLLISDLCQHMNEGGSVSLEEVEVSFAGRLSRQLQETNTAVEALTARQDELNEKKNKAIANEDYMLCHNLKDSITRTNEELAKLRARAAQLEGERDGVCLRVTTIVMSLLRWSGSELRADPALHGTLATILQPMVSLPALSNDVDVAAITAICLFCSRDGHSARVHWPLLLQLVRALREGSGNTLVRARAAVAAQTLADCARLHGENGALDRDEIMAVALSLSSVPFASRQVVLAPLCSWLLSLGHLFFEEHLLEPVREIQWALGWMLVEVFRQRGRGAENVDDQDEIDTVMAMQLTQFFQLLPKLPGVSGAPMLSLAVESIAEYGLWRRAILHPQAMGFHTRFVRTFSWPQLFDFCHQRLPNDMRFRLWRCSLQLCVTSPTLAPLAEIPLALATAAAANQAPAGAAQLVREAIALGADAAELTPIMQRLAVSPESCASTQERFLIPQKEAEANERENREYLISAGITDLEVWAPATAQLPELTPPTLRMRQARRARPGKVAGNTDSEYATSVIGGMSTPMATPRVTPAPTPVSSPQRKPLASPMGVPAIVKPALPTTAVKATVDAKSMPPPDPKRRRMCKKVPEDAVAAGA